MPSSSLHLAALIALHSCIGTKSALAMPTSQSRSISLNTREDGQNQGMAMQIWVPILVVGVLIFAALLTLIWRCWFTAWLKNRRRRPSASLTPARELTAAELAGTINGTTPTTTQAANRTRRTRRARRTPSQMSTTSLPEYAKEPGEQELVIIRGPDNIDDMGMPTAVVVMEPVSEDEETLHSRNNSQWSNYPPMPTTPVDTPLLHQNDSSQDLSTLPIQPPGDIMARRSMDTMLGSEESGSLTPAYEDRGEVPAYSETVDYINPTMATEPMSSDPLPSRRSGFRTLLHAIPTRLSMFPVAHTRADSTFSTASTTNTHGSRETSQNRPTHRPSMSGSGSVLSLTPFRTLSRQSNLNHNLTSPSMISLDSISAPLTHTLTRTEFTYPKSGPTPEQLKLISSRESFARFAVPYGADAIAFAASTSRHNLSDVPPPDFEPTSPGSHRPSRLRSSSNAADLALLGDLPSSTSQEPVSAEDILANDFPATPLPQASPRSSSAFSPPNPLQIPLPSSPEVSSETEPEHSIDIEPLVFSKPSTLTSGTPPASYRMPSTLDNPSASRNTSVASFATAAESLASRLPSHSDIPAESVIENELEAPTTPRITATHILEPSQSTIRPELN
ncbi:hypothetical protein H0H93_012743 [Arthromyces matolae]|nr:hypothetical protein H0H93_012743 [Arthromyces matolae]